MMDYYQSVRGIAAKEGLAVVSSSDFGYTSDYSKDIPLEEHYMVVREMELKGKGYKAMARLVARPLLFILDIVNSPLYAAMIKHNWKPKVACREISRDTASFPTLHAVVTEVAETDEQRVKRQAYNKKLQETQDHKEAKRKEPKRDRQFSFNRTDRPAKSKV